jgi:hypothetical protein
VKLDKPPQPDGKKRGTFKEADIKGTRATANFRRRIPPLVLDLEKLLSKVRTAMVEEYAHVYSMRRVYCEKSPFCSAIRGLYLIRGQV